MVSRSLQSARTAFERRNSHASIVAHTVVPSPTTHDQSVEKHKMTGQYVKSIVYGGLDGLITSFAVVSASVGGDVTTKVLIVLGIANLVADGLSMGLGDFLSSQAELEYANKEKRREKWELENFPDGEKKEMVELYIEHDFSRSDAEEIMSLMMKNKKFFVDHMMVVELGIMPPSENEDTFWGPLKSGVVTFISFLCFGILPMFSYIVMSSTHFESDDFDPTFMVAIILTAIGLFALGAFKSKFTFKTWYVSGLWMLLIGSTAAAVAYFIGWGISIAITDDTDAC